MHKALVVLASAGFLFSGYMSGVKLFSGNCAFNESCPFFPGLPNFPGYPACYYGFAMFTVIFVLSVLLWLRKMDAVKALTSLVVVGVLGILFAGYYTVGEMSVLFNEGLGAYLLGLPTCAYGLIFYLAITGLALKARCTAKKVAPVDTATPEAPAV